MTWREAWPIAVAAILFAAALGILTQWAPHGIEPAGECQCVDQEELDRLRKRITLLEFTLAEHDKKIKLLFGARDSIEAARHGTVSR